VDAFRQGFISSLRDALGDPYVWGGQAPGGFDCSGIILHCLEQAGIPLPDMAADDLYEHFHDNKILKTDAEPGCLYFYWNQARDKLSHVMAVYRKWPCGFMVLAGASGGGPQTATDREAAELGAMVALVPETYMGASFAFAVDPFMEKHHG
jgi:hypothetical protein